MTATRNPNMRRTRKQAMPLGLLVKKIMKTATRKVKVKGWRMKERLCVVAELIPGSDLKFLFDFESSANLKNGEWKQRPSSRVWKHNATNSVEPNPNGNTLHAKDCCNVTIDLKNRGGIIVKVDVRRHQLYQEHHPEVLFRKEETETCILTKWRKPSNVKHMEDHSYLQAELCGWIFIFLRCQHPVRLNGNYY